jgi:transcriptional regulator with XRE-family HTH domain
MVTIAQLVLSHRKKAGLAQAQLATLAGVGKTVIWDVEHGKESVQWDTLQKIFRVLNITVEWHSPLLERTGAELSAEADTVSSRSTEPPSLFSKAPPTSGDPTADHGNSARRARHL